MMFNSKYKKVGLDLYEAIGEIYNFIYKEIKNVSNLNDVVNDDERFSNELLFILFFFSTVKVQEYFGNNNVSSKILDELHNTYYSVLRKNMNKSTEDLNNIQSILNIRYSSYNKLYDGSDNIVLNVTKEFLKNLRFDLNNNLDVVLSVSFWLVKANEILNEHMKKIEIHYKISS